MDCPVKLDQLSPLAGCPGDDELILFLNVSTSVAPNGFGVRRWGAIKDCLYTALLGPGLVMFTGDQLNGSNQYAVSALDGFNEVLYYNVIGFLIYDLDNPTYPNSQWKPLAGGGVQVLIPQTFGATDLFLIVPNGRP